MKKFNQYLLLVLFVILVCSCEKENNSEDEKIIQPPCQTGVLNGFGYVDLGLSVKWANANVGASNFLETGAFFAWGETTPKDNYDWTTYRYSESNETKMTKYCFSSLGTVRDGKYILDASDDAATLYMGEGWRMPTVEEMDELVDSCTWEWFDDYLGSGRSGCVVRSKVKGYTDQCIFLPADGYRGGGDYADYNQSGSYWTSTLDYESHSSVCAYNLFFLNSVIVFPYNRFMGMSIRAVVGERTQKNIPIFGDDIGVQKTSKEYIFTVKLYAGELIDYGWEFSMDENFADAINARDLSSTRVDYYDNILRLVIPKKYIEEDYWDGYLRAYATNKEGTAYR